MNSAIEFDANCDEAYHYRALLRKRRGKQKEALQDFARWTECAPDNPYAHAMYAVYLSTCHDKRLRDGKLALKHASIACELTDHSDADALRSMAAAYAALRDFPNAADWCQRVLDHAAPKDFTSLKKQLDFYKQVIARIAEATKK